MYDGCEAVETKYMRKPGSDIESTLMKLESSLWQGSRGRQEAVSPERMSVPSVEGDDGASQSYDRLLTNATIRVHLDLPANVSLDTAHAARSVVVNRGIPSVINAGLSTVLMADGREPNLETQAGHAILGHAQ